jgi:type I restriction-modification system DNA methylase subunit
MNTQQARALVAETFPKTFDKIRFHQFVRELLNGFNEEKAQQMAVPDAFARHVRSCVRLGTYESPDHELVDVLVVNTAEPWKLQRTRSALRDFVAHKLKRGDNEKEAALVAFVSPTERQWRFSYVKMEYAAVETEAGKVGVEMRLTPARRFSYIVGENESCHTAQSRFLKLLEDDKNKPKLEHLEEAFRVEPVTDEFNKNYRVLCEEIEKELKKLAAKDPVIGKEFTAKNVSTIDFAKKLMGQIVFLYFLQKKGWLGVANRQDWGTGPHDFLRRLVGQATSQSPGVNIFNDVLEPLFYDTLATDRGHEAWCNRFKCRIPFLNGGLFEAIGDYDWRKTDIILPNKLFTNAERNEAGDIGTGILDVFDRYNFTVNEAEPLEKEVAIDPEMLGKVFENLIEDNRRKGLGSFYTPREIVHYMCQESLINYLDTALNSQFEAIGREKRKQALLGSEKAEQTLLTAPTRRELVSRAELETFVHLGDQISHYEAVETRYAIKMPASIIEHARLIDEKLADITVCDPAVGSGAFPVGMMTEIVRARCALTPYFNDVHERMPYHFKRHAIQNCLYGVDIDPGAVEIAKLRLWLSLVVDEEDVKQIKPLPNLFYKIVTGNSLLGVEKTLFNDKLFQELEKLKPLYFDETDTGKKLSLRRKIDELIHELTNGKEVFDFEIYFSEVFHGSGGFDVVIQNPPYVPIKGIPAVERRVYEERYEFATGRFNLFYLFIERCKLLPRRRAVSSFIIPDRLLLNTQCKTIRAWLLNENSICELVSFADQVFETVVVDSILLSFQREPRKGDSVSARRKVSQRNVQRTQRIAIPVSYFELSPSAQFDLNFTPSKLALYRKIKANSVELVRISDTKDGIIQGKVEDHLFLRAKMDSHSELLLFGENVKKYSITFGKNWVNYKPDEMMSLEIERRGVGVRPGLWMRESRIFERPKILTRQTADEIIAAYDEENFYYANTLHGTAITDKAYHPHYVLGVLNSRITTWYYRSNTDEEGKVFAQIKIELLRKMPIPKADKERQRPIIQLVDKILAAKQRDAEADTSALEREIDELVYVLYGLTPEEIKIVEGAAK